MPIGCKSGSTWALDSNLYRLFFRSAHQYRPQIPAAPEICVEPRAGLYEPIHSGCRMTNRANTKPRSRKKRGAVGVIVRDSRLLIIRRSKLVPAPMTFCFPGGGIEENETEEQALVRELQEELCVTVSPVRKIWHSVTSWGVDLAWWLADLPAEQSPIPSPAEVDSIQWCTPAEMERLPRLLGSNRQFLAALATGEIELTL